MLIRIARAWEITAREITAEHDFLGRRRFLSLAGRAVAGAAAAALTGAPARALADPAIAGGADPLGSVDRDSPCADLYPAERSAAYRIDRPLTDEIVAATHNNFYEFTPKKKVVWRLAGELRTRPWTLELAGLCSNPGMHDVDDLVRRIGLEERVYRHRCVEAWAMAVPWTGFELRKLIEIAAPTSKARYVRFVSFLDRDAAPGQKVIDYPWPYHEALTVEEATSGLTLLATGIYGHELPAQHGAPIRLVVPWKYGFKSAKSIRRIEFLEERPLTFWHEVVPSEYGFVANVRPDVPHPRWSQATEEMIGTGTVRPTLMYNGYADAVAHMYPPVTSG